MKYKNFSPEICDKLERALNLAEKSGGRKIAAFDADGTLWDTDLGEGFFKFQIENNLLPQLPHDPWNYYRKWKEAGDPRPAYLWLAQINSGHAIAKVREWAEECVRSMQPLPIFEAQKRLIEKLISLNFEVYVVTASVKWAVEPGAALLGIQQANVLGVETKIIDGKVTETQNGLITYREGKSLALLERTKGVKPLLCSGNTMGDFSLLSTASQIGLAVGATKQGHEIFETEEALRAKAKESGWLIHQF